MNRAGEIRAFVDGLKGWFEEDDSDETTLRYCTRRHGAVRDETPGAPDLWLAREIGQAAEKEFPGLRAAVETVDEWTHLYLRLPQPGPERPGENRNQPSIKP